MNDQPRQIIIIGAGPAGLMAAEALATHGLKADIYDAMPSPARKFLLAGKGGLNLTHSEPLPTFVSRYGTRTTELAPLVEEFGPAHLRAWAASLGIDTFVGTSGRVFPTDFKAAPLLRAWLRRLKGAGVRIHARHRWTGWTEDGALRFDNGTTIRADATILALGGASWPQLGSDGAWVELLRSKGAAISPLKPANCGFDAGWSDFVKRFAGTPLKPVVLSFEGLSRKGEMMLTETGIEGGLVYALSAPIRDAIARDGKAVVHLDLKPDWSVEKLEQALARPRGSRSLSNHLDRSIGLKGAPAALLREVGDLSNLAPTIKALPITLNAPRPIAEAISTAGGVRFEDVDANLMLNSMPGVFVAGEMLDWEAPTGGYLLTACFALGHRAGLGVAEWIRQI